MRVRALHPSVTRLSAARRPISARAAVALLAIPMSVLALSGEAAAGPRKPAIHDLQVSAKQTSLRQDGRDASIRLEGRVDPRDPQSWQLELRLPAAAPIAVTCTEVGNPRELHRLASPAGLEHRLTVRGLKAGTRYQCEASIQGSSQRAVPLSFLTAPLPKNLKPPKISVPSADVAKTGYTLYNYGVNAFLRASASFLVILDAEGNVRWYYSGQENVGAGDVDVSFIGDDRVMYGGEVGENFPPTIVGLDKAIKYVATSRLDTPTEMLNSWNHDAGISAERSSVFTLTYESLNHLVDDAPQNIPGFVVKEVDIATDQTLWTWSSADDGVSPGGLPAPDEPYSAEYIFDYDPYHANAVMDQWEDGRLYIYVGMRNNNSVIKIDYLTGDVVWTLGVDGDFTLLEADGTPATDDRWFFSQHDSQMFGRDFVVYDNGYDRPLYGGDAYSRGLKLELDEEEMTARIALEYTEPNWLEAIFGGFDKLPNGNYLLAIGHNQAYGAPARVSSIVEMDATSKPVWRADFTSQKEVIYRADRIDGCAIFKNARYCPSLGQ